MAVRGACQVGRTQIGRIRYSDVDAELTEDVPFQSVDEILRASRGGELFAYLLNKFAVHSGLSGIQPKVMIRAVDDARATSGDRTFEQAADVLTTLAPDVMKYFKDNAAHREIADKLLTAWQAGVRDSLGLAGRVVASGR